MKISCNFITKTFIIIVGILVSLSVKEDSNVKELMIIPKESNYGNRKFKSCIAFEKEDFKSPKVLEYLISGYADHAFVFKENSKPVNIFEVPGDLKISVLNEYQLISALFEESCSHFIFLESNLHFIRTPKLILGTIQDKLHIFANLQGPLKSKSFAISLLKNKRLLSFEPGFILNISSLRAHFSIDKTFDILPRKIVGRNVLRFCGLMYVYFYKDAPIAFSLSSTYSSENINQVIGSINAIQSISEFHTVSDSNGCYFDKNSTVDVIPEYLNNILLKKIKMTFPQANCNNIPRFQVDNNPASGGWDSRSEVIWQGKEYLSMYINILKQSTPTVASGMDKKGIVMLSYDSAFEETLFNVKFIRSSLKSDISVEIFHFNEISSRNKILLEMVPNVQVRALKDKGFLGVQLTRSSSGHNYHLKLSALQQSEFDKILYLDSDSTPMVDPLDLFNSKAFIDYGLVIFSDMWKTNPNNPVYEIFAFQCKDELEIEAGQWIIDKHRHFETLALSYLIMMDHQYWLKIFFGDKDVVRWAARYLDAPYYLEPTFMRSYGFEQHPYRCGHAMMHYFENKPAFFHDNLLKYSIKTIETRHYAGYQVYEKKDSQLPHPKFYGFNGLKCVGMDGSIWIEDPEDVREFIADYVRLRNITVSK
eukprot:NODE_120_length_18891_cov_0.302682.p3 type:complete len:649 gc:universal NODE_120_length_18891_cov_0.302682:8729-10675(+)